MTNMPRFRGCMMRPQPQQALMVQNLMVVQRRAFPRAKVLWVHQLHQRLEHLLHPAAHRMQIFRINCSLPM